MLLLLAAFDGTKVLGFASKKQGFPQVSLHFNVIFFFFFPLTSIQSLNVLPSDR